MKLRERLSFANSVSVLALVVAVSGSGVAWASVTKNSVRSPHIVNGQVKTVDLANKAVTGRKVKNGSLSGKDLGPRADGTLQAAAMVNLDGTLWKSFNRLGGAVSVVRNGTGSYTVTIPGAQGPWQQKIVGVSTTNSLAECKPWTGDGPTVNVICRRSSTDADWDAIFSIWLIK